MDIQANVRLASADLEGETSEAQRKRVEGLIRAEKEKKKEFKFKRSEVKAGRANKPYLARA